MTYPRLPRLFGLLILFFTLGCGGGDTRIVVDFQSLFGTLSGSNCFNGAAETTQVNFDVSIYDYSVGSKVSLTDQSGLEWTGFMTTDDSFEVLPVTGDERLNIKAASLRSNAVSVEATLSCVSFRCCTVLTGELIQQS